MPTPWKHPDSGILYLRVRVPVYAQEAIGTKLLKRSLRTREPSIAKLRFVEEHSAHLRKLAHIRQQQEEGANTAFTMMDAHGLADRWCRDEWRRVEAENAFGDWALPTPDGGYMSIATIENPRDWECLPQAEVRKAKLRLAGKAVTVVCERYSVPLNPDHQLYWKLVDLLIDRMWDLSSECVGRLHGGRPRQLDTGNAEMVLSVETERQAVPKLSEVFAAYRTSAESLGSDKPGATAKRLDNVVRLVGHLIELYGDWPISDFKKAHLAEYRDFLLTLPATRIQAIRRLPLHEQAERVKKDKLATLSPATVRNLLKLLGSLFSFAKDERDWVDANPVHGLTKKLKLTTTIAAKKSYTEQQLKTIFTSELFTASKLPPKADYGEAPYWLPLIAYYTGCRINEVATLKVADVRELEGICCFLIESEGAERSTKDRQGRPVPIHDDLIELGLLDYAEQLPVGGWLFPKFTANKYGRMAEGCGDWLCDYIRSLGIEINKPLHAFRHTLKTQLRTKGVISDVSHAITGHSGNKSEGDQYGEVTVPTMAKAIGKLPSVLQWVRSGATAPTT